MQLQLWSFRQASAAHPVRLMHAEPHQKLRRPLHPLICLELRTYAHLGSLQGHIKSWASPSYEPTWGAT